MSAVASCGHGHAGAHARYVPRADILPVRDRHYFKLARGCPRQTRVSAGVRWQWR
jgi:hypothetical protein